MERLGRWLKLSKRKLAGFMAVVLAISAIGIPVPVMGSEIWPQKSTAPYYCLDGGKGWKASDRYEIYQYDTLPSALTEVQAKRLFWAYPSNWNALKEAAAKYDPELYAAIASTGSSANVVKRVKDDANTKFAWVADNPEIESRAIAALENAASENSSEGNEVPEPIREATSEENAVEFVVPTLSDGPGGLNTEFKLTSDFIKDIAKIEAQSVWDNGSTGGNVGWLDASQDQNIAKAVLGEDLYELTWSGDSIKIRNNGSVVENENALNKEMSDEEKYNKTTVRYKITMREDSGWYTDGSWNSNYLKEWMDFKACVNAPGHQRLYKADIRIVPSDMVFYLVISQKPYEEIQPRPENSTEISSPDVSFQVYRHEENFESHYNVKLKKVDDETGMPLKGSQFYLYERFEDAGVLSDNEEDGELVEENLNFTPWDGFQIFAEGTTNENGELSHTDTRSYFYSKTYCDGHGMPEWASVRDAETEGDSLEEHDLEGDESGSDVKDGESEEAKDQNRKAAKEWLDLYESCEEAEEDSGGTHFHWLIDDEIYDVVLEIAECGEADDIESIAGADAEYAFEASGCKEDCEATYKMFTNLRFTYTWKEVQARQGYILHGIHGDDEPIGLVTTVSSEAGAKAVVADGNSSEIKENIWYSGNKRAGRATEGSAVNLRNKKSNQVSELVREVQGELLQDAENHSKVEMVSVSRWDDYGKIVHEVGSSSNATGSNATSSNATSSNATSSDAKISSGKNFRATPSNAGKRTDESEKGGIFAWLFSNIRTVPEDDEWGELEGEGDFETYFSSAEEDDIQHLDSGVSNRFSYAGEDGEDGEAQDYWLIQNHRTEGEVHMNKRDMNLYKGESEEYSSYGDTEGDTDLECAVYGLFAAEDILHPDSDVLADGTMTNTGVVYKKNDLVAIAETDKDGNADYFTYTVAPGRTFDYKTGEVVRREDIDWNGPENLYVENLQEQGNWWIGRPLILGNYYVKELSRSEGYELSINGNTKPWTNYESSFETPSAIVEANGTAILSLPELSATMEGEDESGNGYDQLTFSVISSGTTDSIIGSGGYEIIASGFPEDTKFYRVDAGEKEVTGPHVTGTEEVVVKDSNGDIVWKTAESDTSHIKYEPEYDEGGVLIGQHPISKTEPQIQKSLQMPQAKKMHLDHIELDMADPVWNERVMEHQLENTSSEQFCFIKAELERILSENGYDVPVNAEGKKSQISEPFFSVGVVKGQVDQYGMTTAPGEKAVKTVYGAALQEILFEDVDENTTILQLLNTVLVWYQENPQWNFGGLHEIKEVEGNLVATIYAGASFSGNCGFFTMDQDDGHRTVGSVYVVLENPETLRWEYQEYKNSGSYQFQIDKQYYMGSGTNKRYYINATLVPAVMMDRNGKRRILEHQVMEYHAAGEEIVDYLAGDPENGYRVPLTETVDKIEITTELEYTEQDVLIEDVDYDKKTGVYRIPVKTTGEDSFGERFSDEQQSLTMSFMAKLPVNKVTLSKADLEYLGSANVHGYREGDTIGYAEYLMRFADASLSINTGGDGILADTYIVPIRLVYRGQHKIQEDGETERIPVQVLERPIVQKVKVEKEIEGEEALDNFRFKVYLKSNLERLYRNDDGSITWLDRNGNPVNVHKYKSAFPELVQKLYTEKTERDVLEEIKRTVIDAEGTTTKIETYNYEKFFDAINVANTDKWHNSGFIWNTSWKPFAKGLFSKIENTINSSAEAKENAKRSDAVRQFAVDWYLEKEVERLTVGAEATGEFQSESGSVSYVDEIYDKALYEAILKAEDYLAPFFLYDLDFVYEIMWDSAMQGGVDGDKSTLSADLLNSDRQKAYGVSEYLPYGTYVIVEQQPYNSEWNDLENRHYEIDSPKELALPQYFDENGEVINPKEVSWSITEPNGDSEMTGYASVHLQNKRYKTILRIEKLDAETGEPILHEGAVFALYRAERNDGKNGDGTVKRYKEDTLISGSKLFLEAMGAENISPFARIRSSKELSVGMSYTGTVEAGTPVCLEGDCVVFYDKEGEQTGRFFGLATVSDLKKQGILQTTGYLETPEPVEAGAYVLAELKPPSGYVRSKPIAVEVYSDRVSYNSEESQARKAAVSYGNYLKEDGTLGEKELETVRIYVNDTATSLEVSKVKTSDSYRGMKISGRVEGSITELNAV